MAGTQVAQKNDQSLAPNRDAFKVTEKDIKNFICPDATSGEIGYFIRLCETKNLNPFAKEAYLIKPKGTDKQGRAFPAYVMIDFRKRMEPAMNHPEFHWFKYGLILSVRGEVVERESEFFHENEKLLGAWASIKRKDWPEPFTVKIPLSMWNKRQSYWNVNPAHMICKTAITQCFAYCFPGVNENSFPEDHEITDVVIEESQESLEVPNSDSETKQEATLEQRKEAFYVARLKHFFQFMREAHKLTEHNQILSRVNQATNKKYKSLKEFVRNEDDFVKWAEADEYTFDDSIGDLFPD